MRVIFAPDRQTDLEWFRERMLPYAVGEDNGLEMWTLANELGKRSFSHIQAPQKRQDAASNRISSWFSGYFLHEKYNTQWTRINGKRLAKCQAERGKAIGWFTEEELQAFLQPSTE